MRHTRTADSVGVGDTVVDADDEPRTVIAITHVDRSMESEHLRVSDGSGTYHFADERVTVTDDPVPETFEVARLRPDRRIGPTMTPVNDLLPEPDFGDYTTGRQRDPRPSRCHRAVRRHLRRARSRRAGHRSIAAALSRLRDYQPGTRPLLLKLLHGAEPGGDRCQQPNSW